MNKKEQNDAVQSTIKTKSFVKNEFQSLEIKVLNVELEKGYAASSGEGGGLMPWQPGTW